MRRQTSKTRRALFIICLFACPLLFAARGASVAVVDNAPTATTPEARLAVFDDVWRTVGERYYDPAMNGADWAALREEFRPRAADASDADELYALLRRMLARLRDPHTRVHAPGERFDWRAPRYTSVGLRVREIEGELTVAEVEPGAEAERAGVHAGDVVLSVDGEPARAAFARRLFEQPVAPGTEAARALAAAHVFDGAPGTFADVVFKIDDSEKTNAIRERSVRLRRVLRARAPYLRVRRAGAYGVARFNLFTPEIVAELMRALKDELRGARGLVLDLRDNGGGEAEAMTDLASAFLPTGIRLGRFTDRRGRVQLEPRTRTALLSTADPPPDFRAPVVVLTSARTSSAAEVFAAALRERERAPLVGEATCGCVLGIRRRHTLPDGGTLEVSEMDYTTAAGARLEGGGIAPDETVAPTRRDARAGRDRALERALELLKSASRR